MSEEELFPKTVKFADDSAIIAYSLSNENYIVKHGADKYNVKSIFVSNYAQAGGIIKTEPSYCIVVEHPVNKEFTAEYLEEYVVEFVRNMIHGDFDENKICQYIGRKSDEIDNMIISKKVKREIVDKDLEPDLEKRQMDRNYKDRAETISVLEGRADN